jgi:predicted amidohydrolase YtcJ
MADKSSLQKTGTLAAVIALFLISASAGWAQQSADIILYGGNVLTADRPKPDDSSVAEAVAVRGDRIVGVGTNEEILRMAGPQTLKIDLEYKTVIPGRIDTQVPLADLKSAEDFRKQAEIFLAQGVTTVSTNLSQKLDLPVRVAYTHEVSLQDQSAGSAVESLLKSGNRATFDIRSDKVLDEFLEVLESFSGQYDIRQNRFGVEHCGAIRKDQIARAQKFDIAFSCDPPLGVHLEDGTQPTPTEIAFGRGGGEMQAPLRSMIDAGLRPSLQTDSLNYYSFLATQQLIVRAFPNTRILGPQQRISRQEAIYTSTRWAAEYLGKEKELGSIEVGKYADLAVLDRNYLQVRQDGLNEINVLVTILGGKILYTEPDYASRKGLPQVGYRGNLGSVLIRGRLTDKLPYQ